MSWSCKLLLLSGKHDVQNVFSRNTKAELQRGRRLLRGGCDPSQNKYIISSTGLLGNFMHKLIGYLLQAAYK